jgi:ERCC4-related helicase
VHTDHITSYHVKYFSHELTRRYPANDLGKLTASLQDAQVDLNPHQIEAALFAFKSPLSKGAVLADEVGLGKTIEAGIILSQQWAERKRKLLIICPANLRKQWSTELQEKFYLPSMILESKSFNTSFQNGNLNPFNQPETIIICSFQFARSKAVHLQMTHWNLVIIDEAHRLRNVYKPSNITGNAIKDALENHKKVLLTATPLQNSVLELFGLVSLIDPYVFGDLKSFKSQFSRLVEDGNFSELRNRLQLVCKRTLRRQVLEYISYTKRVPLVEEYFPGEDEMTLYSWVSDYLQRDRLYALPSSQRQLMTLILRKLLASSSHAIHGTLDALVKKLDALLEKHSLTLTEELILDFETYHEVAEEWDNEEDYSDLSIEKDIAFTSEEITEILTEKQDLERFRDLAYRIKKNDKAEKLFTALERGFAELEKLGASQKALIFTESRRTQDFIYNLLEARGYHGKVVRFNGVNNDSKSSEIYKVYRKKHHNTDILTGSATADKRAALVEYFRDDATIMIATEAAAEGINLQFCSLIVNFDLPWNPQRIEQRIGRCHRYGQKFDVVVLNFLNKKNAADQRVYQLLAEKFKLFDGVFGASDEVLGSIGNGMDFEKRIAEIYNRCRTVDEIESAFNDLQDELKTDISEKVHETRKMLIENFDDEVKDKLRTNLRVSREYLTRFEEWLWLTTRFFLHKSARFNDEDFSFYLNENPFPGESIHKGPYMILKSTEGQRKSDVQLPDDTNIYRVGHKLAQRILSECKKTDTPCREVVFDGTKSPNRVSALKAHTGQTGWLRVSYLSIESFECEDYILTACITDREEVIESELAKRFFSFMATENETCAIDETIETQLKDLIDHERQKVGSDNSERNRNYFDIEMDKLDQWADDMKISLEKEIKDLDAEIKLRRSEAKKILDLQTKVGAQRAIKELEKLRSEKRQNLFEAQDTIDGRKEALLTEIENRLRQSIRLNELFTIKWRLV